MSETLEQTDTLRVRIVQDDDASNPREEYDHLGSVVSVPSARYHPVDRHGGELESAWHRLWDRYDSENGVEIFQRYARIYHGAHTLYDANGSPEAVWYILPDAIAQEQISDPAALLAGERDEYRAWANGEVYGYVIERRVTWTAVDDPDDQYPDHDTWEHIDSVFGYIGYEYAAESARLGYAHFLADHDG